MNYLMVKSLFFLLLFSTVSLFGQEISKNYVSQDLDTVQITSNRALQIKEIGFHQQKGFINRLFHSKFVYQTSNSDHDFSPAVYIKHPDEKSKRIVINSILLRIRSASKPMKLRLHLYSFNKPENKIIQQIFQKEIVIDDSHKIKEIDLNVNPLEFPKSGILIQVEAVDKASFKLKTKRTLNNKPSSSYLIKNTNHKVIQPFSEVRNDSLNIQNRWNFMIGLSVYLIE